MTTMVPQPAIRGRGAAKLLKEFADGLRKLPGMWLPYPLIPASAASLQSAARKIRVGSAAFPAGQFEAKIEDGTLHVRAINN